MISKERYLTAADGSVVCVTIDGDMVDEIAHGYYGKHASNTEAIYAANPGLADRGPILPAGLVVKIPLISQTEEAKPFRRLWD